VNAFSVTPEHDLSFVIAGLDPAIHDERQQARQYD
jgi:hypothetical protein